VDCHGAHTPERTEYENFEWLIVRCLELNGFERGRHWQFEPAHGDHPMYHCFFDFDGPPTGGHGENYPLCPQVPYLNTVSYEGRMMIIFCTKWYGIAWSNWPGSTNLGGNTRQLQFGVNLLVYALTQEGGITNRVMDGVQ
jgi:hypothetical protein